MNLDPIARLAAEHPLARVQREIMASGQAVMPEAVHTFAPGVYVRGLPMPRDLLILGRMHRTRHLFQLVSGTVLIDNGDGPIEVTADGRPVEFITQPGTKRAIYAVTDAYIQTVHVTPTTDLVALEDELLFPEPDLPRLALPGLLENAP